MRTAILSLFASLFAAAVLAAGASLVAAPGAGLRVRPADWPANQRRKTDPAPRRSALCGGTARAIREREVARSPLPGPCRRF
jgi:hypothetical protein